jgi:TolB-like protein
VKLLGLGGAATSPGPEGNPDRGVDPSADIHALGAVLYHMLAGRPPAATPRAVGDIRKDVPEALDRLIGRCLEESPQRRPPSAHALRRELAEIRREGEAAGKQRAPWIAVLTLADLSLEKDQGYFCEGVTEEIRKRLAGTPGLRVVSRISTLQHRDSDLGALEIGRRLNATAVLEGSLRKSGKTLALTARLLDVAGGRPLWSGEYDRRRKDIFALETQIVRAVEAALLPGEARPSPPPATTDIQAYEFYLRGRQFYYQYRRKAAELALQMFQTAIKHDPAYALAHAGVADCCCFLYLYVERRADSLEQAEAASRRALELGPGLAAAHATRGLVLSLTGQESEGEFQAALRLDPGLFEAHYYYARDSFAHGKLEQAAGLFERAIEVNPDDYQSPLLIAQVYGDLERPGDAEAARRKGIAIVEDQLRIHPGDVRALYMGANGLAALGETQRALEWANLALVVEPREPMVLYNVGCVLSLCGKHEEAIDCLEKAARGGLAQKGWFEHDGDLHPLRSHSRFQALMSWLDRNRSD